MKQTDSTWKTMRNAMIFAFVVALIISLIEALLGADKIFIGACLALPLMFVWVFSADIIEQSELDDTKDTRL